MRLLLVDNLVMPEEGAVAYLDVHPHLGLLALAAAAESGGHQVQIYDPKRLIRSGALPYDETLYERVANELLAARPEAVGFTSLGCSFLFAISVAALLKRREADLPILLGGPHATMLHREILGRFLQFDIIVRHEADEIFLAVLDRLERRRFDLIPGMSWRASTNRSALRFTDGKPKVEDLDRLPITSYDHYPVNDLGLALLRIEAGRGCPFSCTFCSTAGFFQRSFRLKSAERLVKELDILNARYGVTEFKLDHDMFTVNRRKVLEFCEAVAGRGYRWRASARVDCVDVPLLEKMAEAGCAGLYFGIETGSQRMQEICKKRLDLTLVEPILDAAEGMGIETTASFITGYPEETQQDQDDTLDMIGHCAQRASCLPQLHILAPEPGTPMFEDHRSRIAYDGYGGPYNSGLLCVNDEQMVLDHPDIFQTYYYYPATLPRERYIFAVETVDLLRRVGQLVFMYAMRAFAGKVSLFLHTFHQFSDKHSPGSPPTAEMLHAFVVERFGARHHLVSLFRYGLCLRAQGEVARAPDNVPFEPDLLYVVTADVTILADMHDCAVLLDRIRQLPDDESMLTHADSDELGAYVIKGIGDTATSFRVESAVVPILQMFAKPISSRMAARFLADAVGEHLFNFSVFEPLVSCGFLQVARDTPPASIELASEACDAAEA